MTNHLMVPSKEGKIYCRKVDDDVEYSGYFYKEECVKCPMFNGFGMNTKGVVECLYKDKNIPDDIIQIVFSTLNKDKPHTKLIVRSKK